MLYLYWVWFSVKTVNECEGRFFTWTQAVANVIENMSGAWKITSRYLLLHVKRFRHRRSWNAKINTEKMLGMKNHFDISDSIEIHEVDIAGVACICIVCAKYQKASVEVLVQVDFLMYALFKNKNNSYLIGNRKKWLSSQSYHFVKN